MAKRDIADNLLGSLPALDQLAFAATDPLLLRVYRDHSSPAATHHTARLYRVVSHNGNMALENPASDFKDGERSSFCFGMQHVKLIRACVTPELDHPIIDMAVDIRDFLDGTIPGISQNGTWSIQGQYTMEDCAYSWYMPGTIWLSQTLLSQEVRPQDLFMGFCCFNGDHRFVMAKPHREAGGDGGLVLSPSEQYGGLTFNCALQWLYLRGADKEEVVAASKAKKAPQTGAFDQTHFRILLYRLTDRCRGVMGPSPGVIIQKCFSPSLVVQTIGAVVFATLVAWRKQAYKLVPLAKIIVPLRT